MQITLMRHGKPVLERGRWIAPHQMAQWIASYDQAAIDAVALPAGAFEAARAASVVFASTLPRAQSSALALGHDAPRLDALFCEVRLPFSTWRFPYLPASVWAAAFRVCWLFGYARNADSLAAARLRARAACALLVSSAAEGPVLLVGHGVINRLIARELRASGWIATTAHGSGYWGTISLQSS
jgi:broad specificity phosphatase PhoE